MRMKADAFALMSHFSYEQTKRRRQESIRPHLHKDYARLCSPEVPVTGLFFGDDLQR